MRKPGLLFALGFVVAIRLGVPFANAQVESCPQHVAGGIPPALLNPGLVQGTQGLCFTEFAVLHSAAVRTPLWSAEHLTANRIAAADALSRPRVNFFHPEERLPPDARAELSDYAGSGLDRGHMSPSGDMSSPQSQFDSFSLANMVPQEPCVNQGLWERIESAVRELTMVEGELFVVTGPIYQGGNLQFLNGRVGVPSAVYKAIFDPARRMVGAYVAPNRDSQEWRTVSIAELAQMTGIDPFPAVPNEVKSVAMPLPTPRGRSRCRGG